MPESASEKFEEIAKRLAGIESLHTRGRDSLDFHEVSVTMLKEMLHEAFQYGYRRGVDSVGKQTVYGPM